MQESGKEQESKRGQESIAVEENIGEQDSGAMKKVEERGGTSLREGWRVEVVRRADLKPNLFIQLNTTTRS